jgi:transmembrane sensor
MVWPFISRRERLRRQASDLLAKQSNDPGEAAREAAEEFRRRSPDHAAAYDRLSAVYGASGGPAESARRRLGEGEAARSRAPALRYGFAAAAAVAAIVVALLLAGRTTPNLPSAPALQIAHFEAGAGERRIRLSDGSAIHLSAGTILDVSLTARERHLRLVSGEARFTVAHERRPFLVEAPGLRIEAHGTQFVVKVLPGRTSVALLEGSVVVSYVGHGGGSAARPPRQLVPGERLVVDVAPPPTAPRAAKPAPATLKLGMMEFDDTPLDAAVAQANRVGQPRIDLADPGLARLRLTGAFRAGDNEAFSTALAAAFGLELERQSGGGLSLRPLLPAEHP